MIILILYLLLLFTLLLFLIFMSFYSLSLIYSSVKGSPYVATKNKAIIDMFEQIKFDKGKKFLELGSGDGRISRYVASKYGVYSTGVDVNILLVWWARFLTFLSFRANPSAGGGVEKSSKINFKTENIFNTDFRKFDYVYIFLMPKLIKDLEPKLKKELKNGTIVISHGFPIKGLQKKQFKKLVRLPFPTYYYRI